MDESLSAQYAIQIAVHTLRDRCKSLQHRIAVLEEENTNLRVQCSRNEEKEHSLSELDKLKAHVTELTEQKDQLQNRIKMVSNENQDLWNRLGKLTVVNKNLGDQLSKINETVNKHTLPLQPHTALIRSKTFTQDEPQTRFLQKNLEINEKISLELEDVSLKLTDSFSKQKMELDKLCAEIDIMQYGDTIITENFGFCYDEEVEDGVLEDIKYLLDVFETLKEEALRQRDVIQKNLLNINTLKEKPFCKTCEKKKIGCAKSTSTSDIPTLGVDKFTETFNFDRDDKPSVSNVAPEAEKICPICTKVFQKDVDFPLFQQHVEDHFHPDLDTYELL